MANHFVDTAADAGGDGTTSDLTGVHCAWDTIADVNAATFAPGDSILFKCGCTWRETLVIPSAGTNGHPITFSSYGTGDKPKIYGSTVPVSWISESYVPTPVPALAQGSAATIGTTPVTSSFTNTPTEGNLLVCYATGTTVIGNASIENNWTLAISALYSTTATLSIWYKVAGAAESKDVTVTWTSSTTTTVKAFEYSGILNPVLDKTAKTDHTGGTVTSRSSGTTDTITAAVELCIAAIKLGNTISSESWSNSFATLWRTSSTPVDVVGSLTTSAAAAIETTLSWTTARYAGGCIATFKSDEGSRSLYYADQLTTPITNWFVGIDEAIHWGASKASKDELEAEYDWWFDDPNNRLYVYAATDPATRYSSVEVSLDNGRGIWVDQSHYYNYIIVDGFEIAFISGNGIVLREYSTITNNTIHHLGIDTANHSYGAEVNCGTDSTISHNTIYEVLVAGIYSTGHYDPHTTEGVIVESNTVYDCGITLIKFITSADADATCASNIIRYNNLYYTDSYVPTATYGNGILIEGRSGSAADDFEIYQNIIRAYKTGILLYYYTTNAKVYNNDITAKVGYGISVPPTGSSGDIIKNNIIVDSALGGLFAPDKAVISDCDYNCWYTTTGTVYTLIDGVSYHSDDFAAYKAATGWDTHGLWEDPLITSAATPDFHLLPASPCINAGVDVGLTEDIEGNPIR